MSRFTSGPNYKWLVVGLLLLPGVLNLVDRVVIFSLVPLLRKDIPLTDTQVGSLMSFFLWTYAGFSPFAGFIGDLLSRRRILIISLFSWSLVALTTGLVTSLHQLLAMRILLGVTEAFYIPTALAILADFHGPTTRGRAVALLTAGGNLGLVLGGAFAGKVGACYGWRVALFVLGATGMALCFITAPLLREVRPGEHDENYRSQPRQTMTFGSILKRLSRIPSFLCLGLASAITAVVTWILFSWLPVLLYEGFRMDLTRSGFLGNLSIAGPAILGTFLGGFLSDSLGADKPANRMLLYGLFLALGIPCLLLFRWTTSATLVLTATALFKITQSLGETNWHPIMYEVVVPQMRSTATGVSNSFNCLLGGVGPLVAGYYKESLGIQGVLGFVSGGIAIAASGLFLTYFAFLQGDIRRAFSIQTQTIASENAGQTPAKFQA